VLVNTLLVVGAVLVAFPLLWMISVSFMPTGAASSYPPPLLPADPTLDNYRELFAKHDPTANPQDAVANVSYTEARSYVKTRGGRLLTSQEWERAAVTPNFTVRDGLLEWVDSPEEKQKTVRAHGKTGTRPDAKQKDVTFRMARDI